MYCTIYRKKIYERSNYKKKGKKSIILQRAMNLTFFVFKCIQGRWTIKMEGSGVQISVSRCLTVLLSWLETPTNYNVS